MEENEELVRAVYEELAQRQLAGIRYATYRLDDGHSFIHLHESDDDSPAMGEFETFRESSAASRSAARNRPWWSS